MKSTTRKNIVYERNYSEKTKLKRMQSKGFAKQCKERNRLKQPKRRLKKKQQQIATSSSSPTPTTVTTKSSLRRKEVAFL